MKRELDTADRKIVELLQEDARLPLKSIADKVRSHFADGFGENRPPEKDG